MVLALLYFVTSFVVLRKTFAVAANHIRGTSQWLCIKFMVLRNGSQKPHEPSRSTRMWYFVILGATLTQLWLSYYRGFASLDHYYQVRDKLPGGPKHHRSRTEHQVRSAMA